MEDPAAYEKNKSIAKRDAELYVPQLTQLMNWSTKCLSILDYGCGAGSVANQFLLPLAIKTDSMITAVDISKEMLKFASDNYSQPRIKFLHGNIISDENTELFNNNTYDRILSIYVIHFIPEYRKAFDRFFKILKPSGQFGFTLIRKGFGFVAFNALRIDPKWSKYMEGIEAFMPDFLLEPNLDAENIFRTYLTSIGFQIKYLQTNKSSYTGDLDIAIEFFVSLNPFLSRIPKELMYEFKEFHRALFIKHHKVDYTKSPVQGTYDYSMIVCLVEKP